MTLNKYVKSYTSFLNEGAYTDPTTRSAHLSWKNDNKNKVEVLKTNSTNKVTGFASLPGTIKNGEFSVYYGLEADQDRLDTFKKIKKVVPGKKVGSSKTIKVDTNEGLLLKLTMDLLKSFNIYGGLENLRNFVRPTISHIRSKIGLTNDKTYVVSLGSTGGLSNELGNIFLSELNNSTNLPLDKEKFRNIVDALNWEYIIDYDRDLNNQQADQQQINQPVREPILSRVKQLILSEIDRTATPANVIYSIREAPTGAALRSILLKLDPINKLFNQIHYVTWKNPEYIVRSSGTSFGGSRKFLKTKYQTPKSEKISGRSLDYGSPEFYDAVIECIRDANKKMIFVDDNSRTKEDIHQLFNTIVTISEKYIESQVDVSNEFKLHLSKNTSHNFLAYVLIYVSVKDVPSLSGKIAVTNFSQKYFTKKSNKLSI